MCSFGSVPEPTLYRGFFGWIEKPKILGENTKSCNAASQGELHQKIQVHHNNISLPISLDAFVAMALESCLFLGVRKLLDFVLELGRSLTDMLQPLTNCRVQTSHLSQRLYAGL